jgi:hypothetical protein
MKKIEAKYRLENGQIMSAGHVTGNPDLGDCWLKELTFTSRKGLPVTIFERSKQYPAMDYFWLERYTDILASVGQTISGDAYEIFIEMCASVRMNEECPLHPGPEHWPYASRGIGLIAAMFDDRSDNLLVYRENSGNTVLTIIDRDQSCLPFFDDPLVGYVIQCLITQKEVEPQILESPMDENHIFQMA